MAERQFPASAALEGQKVDFCIAPDFKTCSSFIIR
jgi:hypothetical protein